MALNSRRNFLLSTASLAASGVLGTGAQAQSKGADYPQRLVRIVVPGPAGGGTDIIGRTLAQGMSKTLGQQVIVENKPGASSIVAAQSVLASPADGHTLFLGFTSVIQVPLLMPNIPVNFSKDFAPVSLLALSQDLFVVSSKLPVHSVAEFVALAKSKPGKLSIGSYGNGTSSHLHGELLQLRAGIDLIHAPFKGAAPMLNDLLGGQLDAAFVDPATASAHLKSDRLRVLACSGTQRFRPLPQLKTLGELGYAGFESNGFAAIFVAAKTPAPIIAKLSEVIAEQVRSPEMTQRLNDMGMTPMSSTPEELAARMKRDAPRWAAIVKEANIPPIN